MLDAEFVVFRTKRQKIDYGSLPIALRTDNIKTPREFVHVEGTTKARVNFDLAWLCRVRQCDTTILPFINDELESCVTDVGSVLANKNRGRMQARGLCCAQDVRGYQLRMFIHCGVHRYVVFLGLDNHKDCLDANYIKEQGRVPCWKGKILRENI